MTTGEYKVVSSQDHPELGYVEIRQYKPVQPSDPRAGLRRDPIRTRSEGPTVTEPVEPMLQFFEYAHLPEHLQEVSKDFAVLARIIVATLPRNPERTVALRKLLEAKDCAVRASLYRSTDGTMDH